jgi:hypothetical protein
LDVDEEFSQEAKKRLLAERDKLELEASIGALFQRSYRSYGIIALVQGLILVLFTVTQVLENKPQTELFLLSIALIGFTSVFGVVTSLRQRSSAKRASQPVCFYTAVCAAQFLEQRNFIAAGHYVEKLFGSMKWFAQNKEVGVGIWGTSNLRDIYWGDIDKLWELRKTIGKAVMNQRDMRNQFSQNLYSLAQNVFLEREHKFNKALTSIQFFIKVGEQREESISFLDRHHATSKGLGILFEFLKATIAYIVLFILWILSGYHV